MGVHLDGRMSWSAWRHHPPNGFTGLLDIAEVATDVAVVGLGGPAAEDFDGG